MSTSIQTRAAAPPRNLVVLASRTVAVMCFAVHVVLLIATGTRMLAMTVPMVVLSGLCLACTLPEGGPRERQARLVTGVASLAMIVAHLVVMPPEIGATAHDAGHAGHSGMDMGPASLSDSASGLLSSGAAHTLMQIGIALAGLQFILIVGAALRRTSRRAA
ncbi:MULTISPECIES: hypothetical protein [unclassified Mycolicibacterium]|uniref:hypothetical protein n=1 Tax=unclassified Mycolicibacterium TaxID=2636767 RepID=UPI0012DD78A2|nr:MULTISPECIES: hypothetical protein [unclassified Mycolicibacterium]MUL81935.1 hypothetical protein [Mycolicibacterium sp. CBMA 329]MUL87701.1 hypothetical protein [Mycolicibacterium sp. CBMA 331]MUL99436.1 hypothetical protein [Mycolicibacterium sp. CBMA 334]MUM29426.1 hypothetical protein [Mycolicibacterium sp. CBMA 295]MUM37998.1 hypothetical protein [Mycolicibacterium sp. CBMA 247]